jgi:hypothetical protein
MSLGAMSRASDGNPSAISPPHKDREAPCKSPPVLHLRGFFLLVAAKAALTEEPP